MSAEQADQYLVEEIRSGSEAAWRQLIDRYQGRLLAFARSRIVSIADAEDVVQDTFIGFLQSLLRYDSKRSLHKRRWPAPTFDLYVRRPACQDSEAPESGQRVRGTLPQAYFWNSHGRGRG